MTQEEFDRMIDLYEVGPDTQIHPAMKKRLLDLRGKSPEEIRKPLEEIISDCKEQTKATLFTITALQLTLDAYCDKNVDLKQVEQLVVETKIELDEQYDAIEKSIDP